MNNYFHVIWIDDEWESMSSFITYCRLKYNIELTPFKTQKEGLDAYAHNPSFWEAIILDAKVLDESEDEMPDIKSMQKAITRIHKEFDVPYFISTGQPGYMSNAMFQSLFGNYYRKETDDDRLCEDIIKVAKNRPSRVIRDKYSEIFSWYPYPNELITILAYIEENKTSDSSVFNLIRKELDWIFQYCYECGVLMIEFNGANQAECSRNMCKTYLHDYIPEYIQRSIHSTVSISNNGSHLLEIDKQVKVGRAPYLVRSTIFELLNIIHWINDLPKDPDVRILLRDAIKTLHLNNNQQSAQQ